MIQLCLFFGMLEILMQCLKYTCVICIKYTKRVIVFVLVENKKSFFLKKIFDFMIMYNY